MSGLVLDVYGYLTMLNRKINLHGKNKGSSVTYVGIATLHHKLITQLYKVNKKFSYMERTSGQVSPM